MAMTLTEEDFKRIGKMLDEKLDEKLEPIIADLAELKTTVNRGFATDADNLAKTVTVAILNDEQATVAHGLVVLGKDSAYYLLSAAHVIVELTDKKRVRLQWCALGGVWEFAVQGIYLDKNYILQGSHDIGAMALGKDPEIKDYPNKTVNVKCSQGRQVGKLAVGHGLLYLSGSIILDEIDDSPRAMINAMSVGGCSGCPLFIHDDAGVSDHQATLFSLLHGESKHRHSRVAVEHASNHLFADKLRYGANELQLKEMSADENVLAAIRKAEDLVPMNAPQLAERYVLVSSDCPEVIQNIAEKLQVVFSLTARYSTNEIMDLLAMKSLPDQQQPSLTLWDESSTMMCVVPDTPEKKEATTVVAPSGK